MRIPFIIFVATAVYLMFTRRSLADIEFLILHNNDLRARIEGNVDMYGKRYGGFGRIAHVVKEARQAARNKKGPPVLYLYAGDTYRQPVWRTSFSSNLGIEFLNLLRPDASCLGEHDLDRPVNELHHFVKKINFPLITANLHFDEDPYLTYKVKPSVVVRIDADIVVGVIGYVSNANSYLLPANSSIRYEDEVAAVRRECIRLKKEGVDVIVALGYAGLLVDKRIAAEVEDVDVVIGGFTNSMLWNGPAPKEDPSYKKGRRVEGPYPTVVVQETGKRVPVVQTYGFAKYIGRLRLSYDEDNSTSSVRPAERTAMTIVEGDPIFLNGDMPNDEEILTALADYTPMLREVQQDQVVIGQSYVPLIADDAYNTQSNLANLITDSMLEFVINKGYVAPSTFVLMHAGAFKGHLPTSKENPNITKQMIEEVVQCYYKLIYVQIKGTYVKQALEDGVSKGDGNSFLHVGGLRFDIDTKAIKNDRVKTVRMMCNLNTDEPNYCLFDPMMEYRFVSISYFLTQGGHDVLRYQGQVTTIEFDLMDAIIYNFGTFRQFWVGLDDRIFHYQRGEGLKSSSSSSSCIATFHVVSALLNLCVIWSYFLITLAY